MRYNQGLSSGIWKVMMRVVSMLGRGYEGCLSNIENDNYIDRLRLIRGIGNSA